MLMVNTVLLRKIQRKAKNMYANSLLWLEGNNLIFSVSIFLWNGNNMRDFLRANRTLTVSTHGSNLPEWAERTVQLGPIASFSLLSHNYLKWFFPILGSYFGIVEMMDLQPRQPMKSSIDQFVLVERFWGLGYANPIALPSYTKFGHVT